MINLETISASPHFSMNHKRKLIEEYEKLKERADFMEWQLAKTAGALAHEWRETFDELQDVEFYLWLIETFGTDEDKENAGIEDEEE